MEKVFSVLVWKGRSNVQGLDRLPQTAALS
jgi:hypothetical protein